MSSWRRAAALAAIVLVTTSVAAACGDDADTETTSSQSETTSGAGGEVAMRLTVDIAEEAVWEDGSPITVDDVICTYRASLNTPGSVLTAGFDKIVDIRAGDSPKQVVIEFNEHYAPYKGLFSTGFLKAAAVDDCDDVSTDFQTELPHSARQWMIDSFSESQMVLVRNPNYFGDNQAKAERIVIVGYETQDTEIAALKAGEIDFIYPQYYAGIEGALADPNVEVSLNWGGDYEGLYFQVHDGPFADTTYRDAFLMSIDRDALFQQFYAQIAPGRSLLDCGPMVPGKYCDDAFADWPYDPEGAAEKLEDDGWTRNADGFWEKDGTVPDVRWLVNTESTRRKNAQAFLIPRLADAGFKVHADNCESQPCMFQQRLPSLDYDMTMYISSAPPDPQYLVPSFTCDQIPTPENGNQGSNQVGWCNEKASDLLHESDVTVDDDERAELIREALEIMSTDPPFLPLFQFPKAGAWRADRVGGPVDGDLNNYMAFQNLWAWEDLDGDGQIVLGAEQYPGCLNTINECAFSAWNVWIAGFKVQPNFWDTTNDGEFVLTEIVDGEPVLETF